MRIAVIGGGVAGLAAADTLLRAGHEVLLFERGPELGGQLRTVDIGGTPLECFYHHIFLSDTLVTEMAQELGLGDQLAWVPSKVGFFTNGRVWDFVTPQDLLRFGPLPLVDRMRLGLVSLYLQRQSDWRRFEPETAEAWLRRAVGERAYDTVWSPLLYGKFGDAAPTVGMAWFHWKMRLRFGSRRGLGREYLGYLQGSFGQLWQRLGQRLQQQGVHVYTCAQVDHLTSAGGAVTGLEMTPLAGGNESLADAVQHGFAQQQGERFVFLVDRVIATIPSPVLMRLAPELPKAYVDQLQATRYQANMCMLMTLKHPLSHIYWLNISERSIPFVAAIEQTNLIGPEQYGGNHVLYLSNYISKDDPFYRLPDDEVFRAYLPHLQRINPAFREDWVGEWHLFREDAAQPIITTNYAAKIPSLATPIRGLYLANNTQVYPEDRGQNYSIRIGREVARLATEET